jgi:ComF family protein
MFCRSIVKQYGLPNLQLCRSCAQSIPWIERAVCPHCGRPEQCGDCARRKQSFLLGSRSAVKYDANMKQWLAAYKYRRDERLGHLLASMLYMAYKRNETIYRNTGELHGVTYVPVSGERLEERGFNQAEQLALRFAAMASVPVVPLLARNRNTARQSYKSRAERLSDLRDAFAIDDEGMKFLLKKRAHLPMNILIIDDVYTTGSTLHHCAQQITSHVQANMYGLTWAR